MSQVNSDISIGEHLLYKDAASNILSELERRGFTVHDQSKTTNLESTIADIIYQTLRGAYHSEDLETIEVENPWDSELQHQGIIPDEFPPYHPLEN